MSTDENQALYRRMLEAMNRRDLAAAAAEMAPDAVNHSPMPGEPTGLEGFRYRMGMMAQAFPDFSFQTQDLIAEGDKVATRGILTGTNTGSFMGMPPTAMRVQVHYMDMIRIADCKMVEHWAQMDILGLMQQLGVIPAPEKSEAPVQ